MTGAIDLEQHPTAVPKFMFRGLFRTSDTLLFTMTKAPKASVGSKKPKFYAVRKGRRTGIFEDWPSVMHSVSGFSSAQHKSFSTREQAEKWMAEGTATPTSPGLFKAKASSSKHSASLMPLHASLPAPTAQRTIHIDGSALSNGMAASRAGIGIWFGANHPLNTSEPLPSHLGPHTNNRAELYAAYRALELCKTEPGEERTKIVIRTDSEYTIKIFTDWLPSWKSRGWKRADGRPVENADVIKLVERTIGEHHEAGNQVAWEWVRGEPRALKFFRGTRPNFVRSPGHADDEGNEAADRLAKQGAMAVV